MTDRNSYFVVYWHYSWSQPRVYNASFRTEKEADDYIDSKEKPKEYSKEKMKFTSPIEKEEGGKFKFEFKGPIHVYGFQDNDEKDDSNCQIIFSSLCDTTPEFKLDKMYKITVEELDD